MVTANGYAPTVAGRSNKYRVAFSPEGDELVAVQRPGSAWEIASSAWHARHGHAGRRSRSLSPTKPSRVWNFYGSSAARDLCDPSCTPTPFCWRNWSWIWIASSGTKAFSTRSARSSRRSKPSRGGRRPGRRRALPVAGCRPSRIRRRRCPPLARVAGARADAGRADDAQSR